MNLRTIKTIVSCPMLDVLVVSDKRTTQLNITFKP